MNKLEAPATTTLRDYLNDKLTVLRTKELDILFAVAEGKISLDYNTYNEVHSSLSASVELQNIAYLLEYGFITEIGSTSLKDHLPKS